jgi:hypothetical protein
MTREDWILIKNQESWDIPLFYAFYREVGGLLDNIVEFERLFFDMCAFPRQIIVTDNNGNSKEKELSHATAIRKIIKFYNEKFNIT